MTQAGKALGRMALFGVFAVGAAGCSTVEDLLGVDTGHVQVSCSSSSSLPAAMPMQMSLGPLAPGTQLEIRRTPPDKSVVLTLPEGVSGDVFSYDWKEVAAGPERPPGTWQCRAGWQFDGKLWQLQHLDAQWIGGVAR
ncbi:MAG TPA: hypothetical protein VKT74_00675 [Gammaproteobacteria bacterium]|nr:hypothetical protein [Gammaproteobacteria bacterium]